MENWPAFGDVNLLGKFGLMMLQLSFASLLGLWLGVRIAALALRINWITSGMMSFLRASQWLPFIIFWALPVWPPREGYQYDPIVWIWIANVAAVTLFVSYDFLAAWLFLGVETRVTRPALARNAILRSLLYAFMSQVWLGDYGWLRSFGPSSGGNQVGYAALILFMVFLFLLDRISRVTFDQTTKGIAVDFPRGGKSKRMAYIAGTGILWFLSIGGWQILNEPLRKYLSLPPPSEVVNATYHLLFRTGFSFPNTDSALGVHFLVSLTEVFGGLLLGGSIALFACSFLLVNGTLRAWVKELLPLTYVTPIIVARFWINWGLLVGFSHTLIAVAALSFFPCVQVLLALKNQQFTSRLLVAAGEVLPFCFVAMFFGEAVNSTAGIGLLVLRARTSHQAMPYGAAITLMAFALMSGLSGIFRWLGSKASVLPRRPYGEA